MRAVRAAAALAAVAALAACSDGQVQRRDTGDQAGYVSGAGITTIAPPDREAAPAFSGPTLDGGSFDLAAAGGDVVVLNVWGSWCPPCRQEAPALQAVAETLEPEGVRFVGVNTRDTATGAAGYVEEFGITFPSVVDTDGSRLLAFRDTLPPSAIPSTLVVDREGRLAARVLGPVSEVSLRDIVQEVAAEDGSAPGAGTASSGEPG
jgi:thiol-disulfide isomerase/thioredoxin